MSSDELPVPPYFDPHTVDGVWRVPYQDRALEAAAWAAEHRIGPAAGDPVRLCLLLVDVQNTFCIPGFELFVAGRSGLAAVDDNERLCRFIYRNLHRLSHIVCTLDTHRSLQIFHPVFLVDAEGRHPAPFTPVSRQDVESGAWRFNPAAAPALGLEAEAGQRHLEHYVATLERRGKFELTVWPYHALLGGIGHALVSAVEEAVFFHGIARRAQATFRVKGDLALTENYSALGPEVATAPDGEPLGPTSDDLAAHLLGYDAVVVAGQAKSHCVAWTVADLLAEIERRDPALASRVYLLEDCTSPVVVPDVVDHTDSADAAFRRFAENGMHLVRSTDPLDDWPGYPAAG